MIASSVWALVKFRGILTLLVSPENRGGRSLGEVFRARRAIVGREVGMQPELVARIPGGDKRSSGINSKG